MAITESGFTVDIPGTSAATVLNDVSMTQKTKDLIGMVDGGTAFVNPAGTAHTALTSAISDATSSIGALNVFQVSGTSVGFSAGETLTGGSSSATGTFSSFVPNTSLVNMSALSGVFTPGETVTGGTSNATASIAANGTPASLVTSLGLLTTANTNFLSHTNRVSGVSLPVAGAVQPSMQQIVSAASAVTNLKNALGTLQNDPCGQLALQMAGVLLGKDTVENAMATVKAALNDIQNGITTIAQVVAAVTNLIAQINNIIANADAYYDETILQLSRAAAGQLAESLYNLNPCFQQIFEEVIGTKELADKLKEIAT